MDTQKNNCPNDKANTNSPIARPDFLQLPCSSSNSADNKNDINSQSSLEFEQFDNCGLFFTPKIRFKMSFSTESMEKNVIPKSPLKSALKMSSISFNQDEPFSKKIEKNELDKLHKHLEREKWMAKKRVDVKVPEQAVTQLYLFDAEKNGGSWSEAARFVKYEELVEGVDTMWSNPHVPFLPFTALMALRKVLDSHNSMCAIGVDGTNFGEICHFTATELEKLGALDHDDSNSLVSFLTFRREHAKNNIPKHNWIRKITTTGKESVSSLFQREPPSRSCSTGAIENPSQKPKPNGRAYDSFCHESTSTTKNHFPTFRKTSEVVINVEECKSPSNVPEYEPLLTVPPDSIKRRSFQSFDSVSSSSDSDGDSNSYPENCECIQVLVGKAGIFKTTKFILIRLNNPLIDKHLTKKLLPVKFFILIIGPRETNETFLEMGRVMATLCANKQFLTTIYGLTKKDEILTAFDAILNETMIIPPIEIDSPEVFNADEYEKVYKRMRIKKRAKAKISTTMPKIVEEKDSLDSSVQLPMPKQFYPEKPRYFQGFIQDFKNIRDRYRSDFVDVCQGKQMAIITIISLYMSLLPPTVTFGKIVERLTGENLGTMEALMSTCIGGIIWSLLSAQPLLIQGVTGPIMIFEISFFKLCQFAELEYMEVRVYTGIVIALLSFITIAFNGTRLLKYVTKFTEEIFCALIALIYIAETVHYIYHEMEHNPSKDFYYYKNFTLQCDVVDDEDEECHIPRPSAGMLATFVIFFGTTVSMFIYFLRFSKLLGRSVRNIFADFNILITLCLTITLIYLFIPTGILDTVHVPQVPTWTNPDVRHHNIIMLPHFEDMRKGLMQLLVGFIGGCMIFVLLFAETAMVEIVLESKEKQLRKPGGVNWDLMVMSVCSLFCSFFGLHWVCVAGVQTIEHAKGLSFMKKTAPGAKPVVDRVVENRVTTLAVALLFGGTVFLGPILKYIPVACLFGVFMYLGASSMLETTLFKGLINVLHFGKNFRHTETDLNVTSNRIRFYRFLQLVGLIGIYAVKQVPFLAILFPFVFIVFVACRQFILPIIYSKEELHALDSHDSVETDMSEQSSIDFH